MCCVCVSAMVHTPVWRGGCTGSDANDHTKHKTFTPRIHHARFNLMLATCDVPRAGGARALTDTDLRVATPRVNPGSEPVQPPCQTGVWTPVDRGGHTDTTHTYKFTTRTNTPPVSLTRSEFCRDLHLARSSLDELSTNSQRSASSPQSRPEAARNRS